MAAKPPSARIQGRRAERIGSDASAILRLLANQAFSRTAGAPLVSGNRVELLCDASENYPAWLEAIDAARETIHIEMYIFRDDRIGHEFRDHLVARARDGVRVRILYDWLGALGKTSRSFWYVLEEAGAEVRACNPPGWNTPLRWVSRDHRKVVAVDGEVAFVSGLCIGDAWVGRPERGVEAWRDTGVEIRGPAVADVERAFGDAWASAGPPIPEAERAGRESPGPAGPTPLRIIATTPETAGLLRMDLLVAALARRRLWLTDAYFVGTTPYLDALRAAVREGVDVRLLVPGGSDVRLVAALSRTYYRPLLEAGVRIFEWDGSMMHAKTAVADGRWARVGSTNLNLASWLGNWELDVAVEDEAFARQLEETYLRDLEHATEIVLAAGRRVELERPSPASARQRGRGPLHGRAGATRTATRALGFGRAVGAALARRRSLDPAEAGSLAIFGALLLVLTAVLVLWPRFLTLPIALVLALLATSLLARAWQLHRRARREASAGLGGGEPGPREGDA